MTTATDGSALPDGAMLPAYLDAASFLTAIEEYKVTSTIGKAYHLAVGAHLRCGTASYEFLLFLIEQYGVRPRDARVLFFDFSNPVHRMAYPFDVGRYDEDHAVAVVGNVCVDYTARQFDETQAFPLLFLVPAEVIR